MPNLEVVFSVGAGIDQFDLSRVPSHIPVVRMIEPGIVEGMVEYVTQAVLTIHRDLFDYAAQQREQVWHEKPVRAACGASACRPARSAGRARHAAALRFPCAGWTPRSLDGIECYAGDAALDAFLARTDILICLLPLTDSTRGLLGARVFDALPAGASLVQVGAARSSMKRAARGARERRVDSAILDVTDPEPLPAGHPFCHPRIRITPHIASATRPDTAVDAVLATSRAIARASR